MGLLLPRPEDLMSTQVLLTLFGAFSVACLTLWTVRLAKSDQPT